MISYLKNKTPIHLESPEAFKLTKHFLWGYFYYKALKTIRLFKERSLPFFVQKASFLPLIIIALFCVVGNFQEKTAAFSFFKEEIYQQEEVENFVASVAPYTPVLEEEPSLTALSVAQDSLTIEEGVLEKPQPATTLASKIEEPQAATRRGITTYTVLSGDTLSKIARKFGLKLKTLADSNNLSSVDKIKPSQTLLIPPTNGVIHTVKKGETLSFLVKKYQGNLTETLKHNSETIKIGQKVVIAGGKISAPTRLASSRNVVTRANTTRTYGKTLGYSGSRYNGYPWGWCTWYAAYRRSIPRNWGNAGSWLYSAKRAGYATGSTPRAGAVIVTRETGWGHVGYVEAVSGSRVTIREMNYRGWGVTSRRTISSYSWFIKGYIY